MEIIDYELEKVIEKTFNDRIGEQYSGHRKDFVEELKTNLIENGIDLSCITQYRKGSEPYNELQEKLENINND